MSIIKTSYYYAVKNKANDYYKVAISRTAPANEYDLHALILAPDSDTLWAYKMNISMIKNIPDNTLISSIGS